MALQKKFLAHFLKGEDNGWDKQPPVQLNIRHPGEKFVVRHENEWPIARTQWTKYYLQPDTKGFAPAESQTTTKLSFEAQARSHSVRAVSALSHAHEKQSLKPGEEVELDIEIWPTSIVIPKSYCFGLWVRGKDYTHGQAVQLEGVKYEMGGTGPFRHDDASDRPETVFGGTTTLHFTPGRQPYVLLPVIPPKS
jgi:predicted acyl esterase